MPILLQEKFQAQRLQKTMKIFLSDLQGKKESMDGGYSLPSRLSWLDGQLDR
jgi:hypothetical protein